MGLHPPKYITSSQGLGMGTSKSMQRISDSLSISTEVWNDMPEPWKEGTTIIAEPGYMWESRWEVGKPYIITKFKDTASNLIAIYCDVSKPVEKVGDDFAFTDLYLDVWQPVGEQPVLLDEEELVQAVDASYITAEEAESARAVASYLIENLKHNPEILIDLP